MCTARPTCSFLFKVLSGLGEQRALPPLLRRWEDLHQRPEVRPQRNGVVLSRSTTYFLSKTRNGVVLSRSMASFLSTTSPCLLENNARSSLHHHPLFSKAPPSIPEPPPFLPATPPCLALKRRLSSRSCRFSHVRATVSPAEWERLQTETGAVAAGGGGGGGGSGPEDAVGQIRAATAAIRAATVAVRQPVHHGDLVQVRSIVAESASH